MTSSFLAFHRSSRGIQFRGFNDVIEFEVFVSHDWTHNSDDVTTDGGYDALYDELLRQRTSEVLCWFSPDVAHLQKIFIQEQPPQVLSAIRVVKQWRSWCDWKDDKWKPPSYLLSLLVIRAFENACHVIDGNSPDEKVIVRYFIKLVLSTAVHKPTRVRLSWSRFYDPTEYNIEYSGHESRDCPPIVQDPANPANNVAERPISWVLFRRHVDLLGHRLHLMKDGVLLPWSGSRSPKDRS